MHYALDWNWMNIKAMQLQCHKQRTVRTLGVQDAWSGRLHLLMHTLRGEDHFSSQEHGAARSDDAAERQTEGLIKADKWRWLQIRTFLVKYDTLPFSTIVCMFSTASSSVFRLLPENHDRLILACICQLHFLCHCKFCQSLRTLNIPCCLVVPFKHDQWLWKIIQYWYELIKISGMNYWSYTQFYQENAKFVKNFNKKRWISIFFEIFQEF